ncbi:hypothetical protein TIFTF001_018715 [Ficus carica]|uniref:Uncharacterized protein n=1 Tax=Ficus carica TaxID=3494 RepID=A0AA88ACZ9_FICCA|nr:hypothetical protein TIFTF001_018715 [Ficus carica]
MNSKSRSRSAMVLLEILTELGEGGRVLSETPPYLVKDGDRVSPESLPYLAEDGNQDLQSFTNAITRAR